MKKLLILLFCLNALTLSASNIRLSWDRNPEINIATYKLYWGNSSGRYDQFMRVGNVDHLTLSGLHGDTFFAITAINTAGIESEFSNEALFDDPEFLVDVLIGSERFSTWTRNTASRVSLNRAGTLTATLADGQVFSTHVDLSGPMEIFRAQIVVK